MIFTCGALSSACSERKTFLTASGWRGSWAWPELKICEMEAGSTNGNPDVVLSSIAEPGSSLSADWTSHCMFWSELPGS